MKSMRKIDLHGIDLNLLKVFDAILATHSVTKAAQVLRIGQPAASHALTRLRDAFDDELFVRTSEGMQPTEKAQRIAGPLLRALNEVRTAILEDGVFDPAHDAFELRIGMTDYTEAVLLPNLSC